MLYLESKLEIPKSYFSLILLLYIPPQYQFILKEDIIYIQTEQF